MLSRDSVFTSDMAVMFFGLACLQYYGKTSGLISLELGGRGQPGATDR